ncbi:MAG: UTP--glucose-1-phosphate uridylyltransferase GalU [Syntrophorhabdales bacterium]|jgi:UTP--glucose-1-phosphate uridylyltransferase
MHKVRRAIIPAGGFGTRMLPATKVVPKELLPVVDKPLIQFIVEEIVGSGIEEVILITGREKGSIEDHFDSFTELELFLEKKKKHDLLDMMKRLSGMIRIVSVRQSYPMGLGHAILCARNLVNNEPFAVLLPDDLIIAQRPCIGQLLDVFNEYGSPVIAVQTVPDENVSQYGIIRPEPIRDRLYGVRDMIEKPAQGDAPSNLAIIGRYVLPPEIFAILGETQAGIGGEVQLTDAIRRLLDTMRVLGLEYEGVRFDAGTKAGFIKANLYLGLQHPEIREELGSFMRMLDLSEFLK